MKQLVSRTPAAQREPAAHGAYIGRDSLDAEIRFYDAADATFQLLARNPKIGRRWAASSPHLEGIRVWRIKGFENRLVFYRPIEGGVEILHVFHGARGVESLLEDG